MVRAADWAAPAEAAQEGAEQASRLMGRAAPLRAESTAVAGTGEAATRPWVPGIEGAGLSPMRPPDARALPAAGSLGRERGWASKGRGPRATLPG